MNAVLKLEQIYDLKRIVSGYMFGLNDILARDPLLLNIAGLTAHSKGLISFRINSISRNNWCRSKPAIDICMIAQPIMKVTIPS